MRAAELSSNGAAAAARGHLLAAAADAEPLFPTVVLRERRALGLASDPAALFQSWASRRTGADGGPLRYRWTISTKYLREIPHIGPPATWRAWRPAEQEHLEQEHWSLLDRLIVPLVLSETIDFLGTIASEDGTDELRQQARAFLREALPALYRDSASFASGRNAWGDTFALWCFARRPQALRIFYPHALAAAEFYAGLARDAGGLVPGSRFPFHGVPLASASAQLATGLLALGLHPTLVGQLVRYVADVERPFGGWGDAGGPPDPLTTLVCADLLVRLDPTFWPGATVDYLLGQQGSDGWWRTVGPETLWLTAEIAGLLDAAAAPFASRFRWPQLAREQRDRRTGLPFYWYLVDLAAIFAEIPGLASAPIEMAFLDLARFGDFNNTHGMAMGDEVLRHFATELRRVPESIAIRDGGDEFIVLGTPTSTGLAGRLDEFRNRQWPAAFRAKFGPEVHDVAPRILVTATCAADIVAARDRLGRAIGPWKKQVDPVSAAGALLRLDASDPVGCR